jgi:trans-aconitate methyltransferase
MIVKQDHFKYLYLQRGEVSDAYKQGFEAWKAAYVASLSDIMDNIAPALPESCSEILDVGGGMGGIGIFLSRRYPTAGYRVLDGVDDPAEVRSHCKTFNSATCAASFLTANGVKDFGFYEPFDGFDRKFDLVVSFAAWGFHILPGDYLDRVKSALNPHATIILDIRKSRPDYLRTFLEAFGEPSHVLERGKKRLRIAWKT